jgi:hypothetical protein
VILRRPPIWRTCGPKLGLDQPLLTQYRTFLTGLVAGNLGTSFRYNTPVAREIGSRLGRTAQLAMAAMAVALVIAIPLGIVGALFRGSTLDHIATTLSLVGVSMPNFWLGTPARHCVRGDVGLAAGVRNRDSGASRPAGRHAGRRACGDSRAHDAGNADRRAQGTVCALPHARAVFRGAGPLSFTRSGTVSFPS